MGGGTAHQAPAQVVAGHPAVPVDEPVARRDHERRVGDDQVEPGLPHRLEETALGRVGVLEPRERQGQPGERQRTAVQVGGGHPLACRAACSACTPEPAPRSRAVRTGRRTARLAKRGGSPAHAQHQIPPGHPGGAAARADTARATDRAAQVGDHPGVGTLQSGDLVGVRADVHGGPHVGTVAHQPAVGQALVDRQREGRGGERDALLQQEEPDQRLQRRAAAGRPQGRDRLATGQRGVTGGPSRSRQPSAVYEAASSASRRRARWTGSGSGELGHPAIVPLRSASTPPARGARRRARASARRAQMSARRGRTRPGARGHGGGWATGSGGTSRSASAGLELWLKPSSGRAQPGRTLPPGSTVPREPDHTTRRRGAGSRGGRTGARRRRGTPGARRTRGAGRGAGRR